jgi:hypothetical protein
MQGFSGGSVGAPNTDGADARHAINSVPPICHPKAGDSVGVALEDALRRWNQDRDAAALRRGLLGVLFQLE